MTRLAPGMILRTVRYERTSGYLLYALSSGRVTFGLIHYLADGLLARKAQCEIAQDHATMIEIVNVRAPRGNRSFPFRIKRLFIINSVVLSLLNSL